MLKPQILIVEDEAFIAQDIRQRLQGLGYCVVAYTGQAEEAVRMARDLKPDLVLMDVMLADEMDGIQAAKQIRKLHQIPVVYLTAYSDRETLERAKLTEPFGYILKPFESRDLESTIEMALYRHRMEREREQLIEQLQEALASIKTLRGLLPICSYCKKIKDDDGYWNQVEAYVAKYSQASFSHGMCPECYSKVKLELEAFAKGEAVERPLFAGR
jgi:two-component system, response regulator PdtaR